MIGDLVYKFTNKCLYLLYRLNRVQDRFEYIVGNIMDPAPPETMDEGLGAYCQRVTAKQALRYTKYNYLIWRDNYLGYKNVDFSSYGKRDREAFEEYKKSADITYQVYQKYYLESKERVEREKDKIKN